MRCGNIAIIGRPNVGKSTFLNCVLGHKLSITSRKPNTTRNAVLGVYTKNDTQLLFMDTPGWQTAPKKLLNRHMNREVRNSLRDIDCVLMLADARGWRSEDDAVVSLFTNQENKKIILALNKVDLVRDKQTLLNLVDLLNDKYNLFNEYLFISAKKKIGIFELCNVLSQMCPKRVFSFDPDTLTNRSERFLISELVREKLFRHLGEELPYETKVSIDNYKESKNLLHLDCSIWVERDSQKAIIIGKDGLSIKKIGTTARVDIENLVGRKVYINLWVKVRKGWRDDLSFLEPVDLKR
tara:strand:+ start:627 stop:1514 length:888 start_codon:yes stop_codon:yes gene_type:complete